MISLEFDMSSSILTLLDYISNTIAELEHGIQAGSLTRTRFAFEKLTAFSDCLKSLLPEEFVDSIFGYFDQHIYFVGVFLDKENFEMIERNFSNIKKSDFPDVRSKIYDFIEKGKIPQESTVPLSKNIFLVHGRDRESVKELKSMLKEFGLNPIVLHEKASGSRTIVEKLEKYAKDVGYAFVILTPDDTGCQMSLLLDTIKKVKPWLHKPPIYRGKELNKMFKVFKPRARQNVVLEFGYFMGQLNRDKVCCLYKGDIELPSDMQGIVYVPFKKSVSEAHDMIIKELKAAGYEIKI